MGYDVSVHTRTAKIALLESNLMFNQTHKTCQLLSGSGAFRENQLLSADR